MTAMKKHIIYPMIALALCACSPAGKDNGEDIDTSGYTVFSVDIENLSLGGAAQGGVWEEGASIGVFGSEQGDNEQYFLRRDAAGLQAATFYGSVVKGKVSAYSPFAQGTVSHDGTLPCELSPVQEFDAASGKEEWFLRYNPRTFASADSEGTLHFRYPMGLMSVRFEFQEEIEITSFTLNCSRGISGRLDVNANGEVSASGLSHKYISLDLGDAGVSNKTEDGFTEFLLALPPGVYQSGELRLNVITGEDEMEVVLGETEIRRVEGAELPVTAISVGTSDLPGFEKEHGYLE